MCDMKQTVYLHKRMSSRICNIMNIIIIHNNNFMPNIYTRHTRRYATESVHDHKFISNLFSGFLD